MEKEIILTFQIDTGEVIIEANGFKGRSCKDATKFLETSLGECTSFKRKKEYFEENIKLNNKYNSNLCG